MKKIIWITSYPKSGNTWMRFLLANYFFNKEKVFNYDIIDYIKKFTTEIGFSHNDKSPKSLNEISKKWSLIQKNWEIIDGDVVFLKNHNANIEVDGNQFLEELSALAIIHIVRDPRDLIISGSNFWRKSHDWVINKICNENLDLMFGSENQNYNDLEVHGSWKLNFNSWNNIKWKIPYILIRYEDLIENCEEKFESVIIFLSKILGFVPNMDQLKFAVENSKFDNLSNNEKKYGFKEISNGQTFFNSGKIGQWKKTLSSEQISIIENYNFKEMKMLRYL